MLHLSDDSDHHNHVTISQKESRRFFHHATSRIAFLAAMTCEPRQLNEPSGLCSANYYGLKTNTRVLIGFLPFWILTSDLQVESAKTWELHWRINTTSSKYTSCYKLQTLVYDNGLNLDMVSEASACASGCRIRLSVANCELSAHGG